jgi:AcrR family transcriptional regulator
VTRLTDPAVGDIAATIAARGVAAREARYAEEVRRLLDAGLAVMRECGTASSPRVADIVTAAGLSNDAFYRHFASKEALVAAIFADGTARLVEYLRHQMAKGATPEARVRRWVEGILAQAADEDAATTTRAVMWNAGSVSDQVATERPSTAAALAALLLEPLAALGSADPEGDAVLAAHAVMGRLSDCLGRRTRPTRREVERTVAFCLAAVGAPR